MLQNRQTWVLRRTDRGGKHAMHTKGNYQGDQQGGCQTNRGSNQRKYENKKAGKTDRKHFTAHKAQQIRRSE